MLFTILRASQALIAIVVLQVLSLHITNQVLGDVLFTVTTGTGRINQIDSNTGALLNSFVPPVIPQSGGGNGLAYSGSTLYYSTIDANLIYSLDPVSGAVINSFAAPGGSSVDALGFGTSNFGDTLFALDYNNDRVNLINPTTGAVLDSYVVGFNAVGGMDFNSVTGTLFVSDPGVMIRELNPDSGSVVNSFALGVFQYGIGLVGSNLFTSDGDGLISLRDSASGVLISSYLSPGGYASALAGGPAVPEPNSLMLVGFGAFVLSFARRPPMSVYEFTP